LNAVTLKDLAKELNLSINTVSRALRNMPDISEETKKIVRETAERMNYQTNMAASMLRTNRSKAIGVIVSDINNPVFSGMIKGVTFACKEAGYSILLSNTNEDYEEELSAVKSMLQRNVDGILLFPSMVGDGSVQELIAKKIPFVMVGRYFSSINTNIVMNDDVHGGYLAAEHLFQKGHRNFIYITGSLKMSSSSERLTGFRQYLTEHGLSEKAVEVHETEATWKGGYKAMLNILKIGTSATAVFAFSDFMAMGILKALRKHNIHVPSQMAVIGYDDIDFCELTVPALTTIDMSKFRLGKRAAELLIRDINTPAKDRIIQRIIMEPKLIVREST